MIGVRNGHPARARMVALGAHVPELVVTNDDLAERVDTNDEWIVTRTGIRERRFAARDEAASDLGVKAAQAVLEDAGVDASEVDTLILATTTPDHLFPSTGALVASAIGADNAAAYDLMTACTGFVYGLAQATAAIEAGLARKVLVVGAEVMSRILDFDDRSTCVLFGDGAAGALLVAGDPDDTKGFMGFELGTDGSRGHELVIEAGGGRLPVGEQPRGDACYLQMNGREVFKFATRAMVDSAQALIESLEMPVSEIDLLVPHQANIRIIEHAIQRLEIPPERVYNNLERYGNTSSASIPLALTEARDEGRLKPGDRALMIGFGGGLSWGSAIGHYEPL